MQHWTTLLGTVMQDTRYALRWFRRDLSLTGAIVLTLAFGIGLNTGVFSVLSGMVFRSRVEKDSAGFFQILASPPSQPDSAPRLFASSAADWNAYRAAPGVAAAAAWAVSSGRFEGDSGPSLLLLVSCDFFRLYGLDQPKMGRLFQPADCAAPGAAPVVLLSEQLWRDRFHADARVLGREISIGSTRFTVAGIVPADFAGRLRGPGIWIPFTMQAPFYGGVDLFREDRRAWLTVEGRRSPGISQKALERELNILASRNGRRTIALTNGSIFQDPSGRALAASITVLVFGALGLILLLACTNVTMLLLSRAVARRYEISVRLSLGASRSRLFRMAATEGILLALLSGGLSAALAAAVPATLVRVVHGMPHYPMHTDWVVFGYLAGVTLLAGSVAALVPAAESLRTDLNASLRRRESAFSLGRIRLRLREALVTGQVAMSLVLVVTAALFARTQYRLFMAYPGFDARHVLVAPLESEKTPVPTTQVDRMLRGIHGIHSIAFASSVFWSRGESSAIRLPAGRNAPVAISEVSPDFFLTLGIPIVRGSLPSSRAPEHVLVSEPAAERFWPHADPVNRTFRTLDGSTWTVAGVVGESDLDRRSPLPRIYRMLDGPVSRATLLVRCEGDPEATAKILAPILDSMGVLGRELPHTVEADINEMGSRFRVLAGFALFFGGSAFLLAVIGIYGVMAFVVSRRTKEMGIRLALGATRADIVRHVLLSGLRPVAWGLAVGLASAAAFAFALERAYRNTPTPLQAIDWIAFGPVAIILAAGAAIAILRPALRACAVNPAQSLRQD